MNVFVYYPKKNVSQVGFEPKTYHVFFQNENISHCWIRIIFGVNCQVWVFPFLWVESQHQTNFVTLILQVLAILSKSPPSVGFEPQTLLVLTIRSPSPPVVGFEPKSDSDFFPSYPTRKHNIVYGSDVTVLVVVAFFGAALKASLVFHQLPVDQRRVAVAVR